MALIPELLQEFEVELADRSHRQCRTAENLCATGQYACAAVRSNLPVTRDKVICDLSSTLKQISAGANAVQQYLRGPCPRTFCPLTRVLLDAGVGS